MGQIRIKTSKGWKKVVGNTASHYHQDEEPTEAVAGDIWMTDEDESTPFLQKIYDITFPVGSTKVCLNSSDIPIVPEGVTATWELSTDYDGKALWVDSTSDIGTSVDGSLPNITGSLSPSSIWKANNSTNITGTGAFSASSGAMDGTWTDDSGDSHKYGYQTLSFKASGSNSIYGAAAGANVVRPTSVTVKVYKRTA